MATKRLLIVSASMGAGHDAAARTLVGQAERAGHEAKVVDLLAMARLRQGDALRVFYHAMITAVPGLYDWAMRTWLHHPGLFETITSNGGRSSEARLLAEVEAYRPDAMVAVYNLAGQVLGRLRSSGRLTVPAATYVTDPGAHPYWVWPGVDLHLAPLAETAADLEGMGAEAVKTVAPLVAPRYLRPEPKAQARERWDIPSDARVVLVNGGSWGVGNVARAAALMTQSADLVVVLCGRSERLQRRIAQIPGVRGVPWTDDVAGLLAAADVVVDNAGGTTCWEALASGLPIIVYRPIAGHGRINAITLESAGLAVATSNDDELLAAVAAAEPPAAAERVFAAGLAIDVLETLW